MKQFFRRLTILLKNLAGIPKRLTSKISLLALLSDSQVDPTCAICSGARVYRTTMGKYSYIGRGTFITNAKVGSFCSIAGNCNIGGTGHPLNWVSTSSVFHKWDNILGKNFSRHEYEIFHETQIGSDVWIATNAMLKAGITVGCGAVIGMGAVVTKDVGPYEIWGGNPARCIRKRFDDETIARLLESCWWELPDDAIEALAPYMTDVNRFLEEVEKRGGSKA